MDRSIEQLIKIFTHIAREIQIYFLSGFLLLLNIYCIDYFYYESSLYHHLTTNILIVPTIIISYIIGQICMAIYYVIFELTGLEQGINKKLGIQHKVDSKILPHIYNTQKETYQHFIERYVILVMMRSTLTSSLLLMAIINLIYLIFICYKWQICLIASITSISFILMYILTARTECDYSDRIESMK